MSLSFADRLKAAVNKIDAAGNALQTKALSAQSTGTKEEGSTPSSPIIKPPLPSSTSPLTSPGISADHQAAEHSPTRSIATTYVPHVPLHLAENALSGLSGLRKSFNLGSRTSLDGRPPGTGAGGEQTKDNGPQELKDIPNSPKLDGTHPASPTPSRFLQPNFSLGSSSTVSGTPLPRSPPPPHSRTLAKSPLPTHHFELPPSDPSDPSSYPLPPSPDLTTATPTLSAPSLYADPLGASPLLSSVEDSVDPPTLVITEQPTGSEDTAKGSAAETIGVHLSRRSSELAGDSPSLVGENGNAPEVEAEASNQLADAQRRYEDLSERFTTLLAQSHNANKILRELTPLEGGIQDVEAMEGWIRMMNGKVEMITEEMKRLQGQIKLQDSRMDELRDTHRLEGGSQAELITKLRSQLSTAETNLSAKATELLAASQLRADLSKAQTQAKEEEEKRTKAISLLKTVRMKLVKVEKEKEEIERDRAEERAERSRAGEEVERVKAEREREVNNLRKGFERELSGVREKYEKELASRKAAWELEMITTKATHAKDLSIKSTKISGLEAIVKELNVAKQAQFDSLQSKQADVENFRAQMEGLESRTKELEFQLREATERCALLEDSIANGNGGRKGREALGMGRFDRGSPSPSPSRSSSYSTVPGGSSNTLTSPAEVQRLLAEAETRAEGKLADLRARVRTLERERNEAEEEWAVKLQERVREVERLRRVIQEKDSDYADSERNIKEAEGRIQDGEEKRRALEREMISLRTLLEEAKGDISVAVEAERAAKEDLSILQSQISNLRAQIDDSKAHANQLRTNNKTLREELRKVQSSVQLMERQRNPGVGYWSAGNGVAAGSTPASGPGRSGVTSPEPVGSPSINSRKSLESLGGIGIPSDSRASTVAGTGASTPASETAKNPDEEEVNLEYLRNVILQFLEHKEMRPNLVRVLSVILRFTPQELRRLNSKLLS